MAQIWSESRYWRPQYRSKGPKWWTLGQIWGFLARFGPFCFNLGHYAWIWAILPRFGPYCLDLGYLAEFGSEWAPKETKPWGWGRGGTDVRTDVRTDGRTDGQIPPVFYRTLSPSGPLPKKHATLQEWRKQLLRLRDGTTERPMDRHDLL